MGEWVGRRAAEGDGWAEGVGRQGLGDSDYFD